MTRREPGWEVGMTGRDKSGIAKKHLVLHVEIPTMYVEDIEGLRDEYLHEFQSESDFILNCIGEPSIVRLRCEISGEKDSDVVEVWGHVRAAELAEASRGYEPGHLIDDQLEHHGFKLMRDENACEWCRLYESTGDELVDGRVRKDGGVVAEMSERAKRLALRGAEWKVEWLLATMPPWPSQAQLYELEQARAELQRLKRLHPETAARTLRSAVTSTTDARADQEVLPREGQGDSR